MTTEEVTAAAVAENLTNPDGSDITTEEQLAAAKELAAKPPEETDEEKATREAQEKQQEEDPLLKTLLENTKTGFEPVQPAAAPTQRETDLATLKEWGVEMPQEATDEEIAAKVAEGKPVTAAAPAAPATPAAKQPAKKKKFTIVPKEAESLVQVESAAPATVPAAPAVVSDPADDEYVNGLTDGQRDELKEAEVAEMLEPVKYKGHKAKLLAFYRKFDAEAPAIHAEAGEQPIDDNPKFQTLMRSKPTLDHVVSKKVNREIGAQDGAKKAQQKLDPEMAEIRMNQRRQDYEPKFDKFITDHFMPGVQGMFASDPKSPMGEAMKMIAEKGEAEAVKEFGLETRMWQQERDAMKSRVRKFLLFANGALKYNPDKPDADIDWLTRFVEDEGRKMADYEANQIRLRKPTVFAKTFLPRNEFMRMISTNLEERKTYNPATCETAKYVTFTNNDILSFMATKLKMTVESRIKTGLETAEELGFQRAKPAKMTQTATAGSKTPTEVQPPRATPSAARGAAKPPSAPAPNASDPLDVSINLPPVYDHLKSRR
jgi:hypothetical protein